MTDPWAAQRAAVGDALREQGITQRQAAIKIGVSEKHMSQMLTGKADGRLGLWTRLADLLGMTWSLTKTSPEKSSVPDATLTTRP